MHPLTTIDMLRARHTEQRTAGELAELVDDPARRRGTRRRGR